jgi:hypothetical protein
VAVALVVSYVKPGRPEVPPEVVKLYPVRFAPVASNVKKPVTVPPSSKTIGVGVPTLAYSPGETLKIKVSNRHNFPSIRAIIVSSPFVNRAGSLTRVPKPIAITEPRKKSKKFQ